MFSRKDVILGWPVYRLNPFSPSNKEFNRISILDRSTGKRGNGLNQLSREHFISVSNAVIRTRDEALKPFLFAEGAVGVGAFLTILAKPPMTQKGQLRLTDFFAGQNPGQ